MSYCTLFFPLEAGSQSKIPELGELAAPFPLLSSDVFHTRRFSMLRKLGAREGVRKVQLPFFLLSVKVSFLPFYFSRIVRGDGSLLPPFKNSEDTPPRLIFFHADRRPSDLPSNPLLFLLGSKDLSFFSPIGHHEDGVDVGIELPRPAPFLFFSVP